MPAEKKLLMQRAWEGLGPGLAEHAVPSIENLDRTTRYHARASKEIQNALQTLRDRQSARKHSEADQFDFTPPGTANRDNENPDSKRNGRRKPPLSEIS
jgi:hypothetical protein